MDFFYSIVGFVLAISILVFVHELGHFLVARLLQVKVLKFSIGFGPSYSLGVDKAGTEYLISLIPLGGYVQLLDNSDLTTTSNHSSSKLTAITEKSPWVRISILLAGPVFNLIFAWIIYVWVFMLGITSNLAVIGKIIPGSIAATAKLQSGMQIKKIAGDSVDNWHEFANKFLQHLSNNKTNILIETYSSNTAITSTHILKWKQHQANTLQSDLLKNLGLEPFVLLAPAISKVIAKSPAAQAGLRAGDVIVSINNIMMEDPKQVLNYLSQALNYLSDKSQTMLKIQVLRQNKILLFNVVPALKSAKDSSSGFLGIQYKNLPYPKELTMIRKYGIINALQQALIKTSQHIKLSGYFLISIITGKLSWNNTAGPIAIGYYAGQSIKNGLEHFLNFLGMVSINLGILNLLPIPWLDGGSIIHAVYELIRSKPANPKLIQLARNISLVFLLAISILTFINDLLRL